MADASKRVDIQNLLSLGDDLVQVLRSKKDAETFALLSDAARSLHNSYQSDSRNLQFEIQEHEKKISICNDEIEKTAGETIADVELKQLEKLLEEKLQEEALLQKDLRVISEELDVLDHQMLAVEEKKGALDRRGRELLKARDLLSMCASVTKVIPILEDEDMIRGYIVRKDRMMETFQFEKTTSPQEMCDEIWGMAQGGCRS